MYKLTDRLRGLYSVGPNNEFGATSFDNAMPTICFEAANKIEELEGIISQLTEESDTPELIEGTTEALDSLSIRDGE